ncbi:hypothetical protein NG819_15005 [Pseudarthrobacter sp. Fe7]|nr:hypothetical protein NG819_15005 [Pseudarthrobacter sp. Fe7]
MSISQDDVHFTGHAIECRINAEDPSHNFFPSPGTIRSLDWPSGEGIRVDTGVEAGSVVSPYYDSLLAKLAVHAADRDAAIAATLAALEATHIEGVKTTVPVHLALLARPEFAEVSHHSKFIETAADLMGAK